MTLIEAKDQGKRIEPRAQSGTRDNTISKTGEGRREKNDRSVMGGKADGKESAKDRTQEREGITGVRKSGAGGCTSDAR